jgi:periplasmic divalent cation tolerance protein
MSFSSLYVTAASRAEALAIGKALVGERLAACANVFDGIASTYWWQGTLTEDAEAIVIVKTRARLVRRAIARIKALHSYTVPCIVEWRIGAANRDYTRWIAAETRAPKRRKKRSRR